MIKSVSAVRRESAVADAPGILVTMASFVPTSSVTEAISVSSDRYSVEGSL